MPTMIDLGKVKGNGSTINGKDSITLNGDSGIIIETNESSITIKSPGLLKNSNDIDNLVDKVEGKQLTTENFTTELKNKLESIQEGATVINIDTELSTTSMNPLQTKIITGEINKLNNTIEGLEKNVPNGVSGQVLTYDEEGVLIAGSPINPLEGFEPLELKMVRFPTKQQYFSGDSLDLTGAEIVLKCKNGTEYDIPKHLLRISPEKLSMENKICTISYTHAGITVSTQLIVIVNKRILKIPVYNGYTTNSTSYEPNFLYYQEEYINKAGNLSIDIGRENYLGTTIFSLKDQNGCKWEDGSIENKRVNWKISENYCFELNLDESNPANMITYKDLNQNYRPAKMVYNTENPEKSKFDYGDWEGAWFIRDLKPVMLGFDGQVKYELNKNNYKEKATGGSSDVANTSYQGNVMVGIPTVWIKVDNSNSRRPKFYFADRQVDSNYKAYAHTNNSGVVKEYTYMAAYDCWYDGSKIRSISGQFPKGEQNMDTQRNACKANGTNWDIGTFSDRMLITLLLMLISKSADSQTTFGQGNTSVYSPTSNHDSNKVIKSGTLDDKGLFYGYKRSDRAVKVFGVENLWGNVYKRVIGLIVDNRVFKYKLTKGTQDGSSTSDYSTTSSSGYLSAHNIGTDGNFWIYDMKAGPFGLLPVYNTKNSSATTYFCDYAYTTTASSMLYPVTFGGYSGAGTICGIFTCTLNYPAHSYSWNYGVSLSYKPNI